VPLENLSLSRTVYALFRPNHNRATEWLIEAVRSVGEDEQLWSF
jgi:hypothetical protein